MSDDTVSTAGESGFVEVARAHDRFEAAIWTRNLEELGIEVKTETRGSLLRAILYLGRVPVAVFVPRKDSQRAHDYLKEFRFI